ncbi:amidohydrolase family protein [Variovorax sp. KK3]|uniref:amidohydrolase family protein n=1 Tax=Variovorax sp. KK3 TaxID=1855728 RepID=UPI00097C6030|nr:amidohydrolase family protein [Variovorax sp. KK3]
MADDSRRIDTHQHIVPPAYAAWLDQQGMLAGGLPIPHWSAAGALDLMDSAGIAAGILSVSTPGVHLGDDAQARAMARKVNEFAAQVSHDHPGRFGFFATLTLPDVDGALAEAAYALDELGADGVVLLTNVRGTYLGDAAIEPLMEELDRRRAVVFVHPSELPTPPVPGIPPFVADFLLDTTRAGINMCRRGWMDRFPGARIILSHGGGFIPYAAERIARMCSPDGDPVKGIEQLRRFHFDTALSSSPYALPSLLAFADPQRITFGSDWPYAPKERSLHFTRLFDEFALHHDVRAAIDRGNAEGLFPRFA